MKIKIKYKKILLLLGLLLLLSSCGQKGELYLPAKTEPPAEQGEEN